MENRKIIEKHIKHHDFSDFQVALRALLAENDKLKAEIADLQKKLGEARRE